jgi:hypothetical protein
MQNMALESNDLQALAVPTPKIVIVLLLHDVTTTKELVAQVGKVIDR